MGRTRRKYHGGMNDFFDKAAAHVLSPTIVNADSNFVVITYWWGRGNLNKNTQRPCPEELKPGDSLTLPPITFEKMIENWENACKEHTCNYMAEEYAEFAVKGGYQHAINFKPAFIELALKACAPRGVLYIDGDMKIKVYPGICDIKDVDYMARGWNTDPRPQSGKNRDWYCFDPYAFEMSGGTMFFADTVHSKALLDVWKTQSKRYPGKADDRILSLSIMRYKLLAPLSSIQLPIEYLWLDLDYDVGIPKNVYKKKEISISHPECLTGEDRAEEEGASHDRYPRGYDRYVTDIMQCGWEEIFEYIHFDSPSQIGPFRQQFDWLEDAGIVDLVRYKEKYGPFNKVAKANEKLMNSVGLKSSDNNIIVSKHMFGNPSLHQITDSKLMIPTILKYLENGQNVIYIPEKPTSVRFVIEKANKNQLDFVTRNTSKSKKRSKPEYYLEMDHTYPIYFGAKSNTLKHLLRMSDSFESMQKIFNRSYIFLTRIHCGWI